MSSTSGTPATSNVSFTVRRPTPTSRATSTGADSDESSFKVPALPRHLTNGSTPGSPLARSVPASPKRKTATFYSSDEEEEHIQDELVTGFDQFGVQRVIPEKKKQGPMVIAPLQNRDWREVARRRRAAVSYVPPSAQAGTGADGSVGGLGTRDAINSGPVLQGLQMRSKRTKVEVVESEAMIVEKVEEEEVKIEEISEDQRALRALLAGAAGEGAEEGPIIDIIPSGGDVFGGRHPTEDDAFQQDIDTLPDVATLNDYERVPVSQFGAALLRGMGWKEGQAASRKGKGPVEPWLPQARPALLGIGAKEKEVHDHGGQNKRGTKRPERRYVPVIKKDRDDGERSGSGSGTTSRRRSPERDSKSRSSGSPSRPSKSRRGSPSPARSSRKDQDYDYDKGKGRDRGDRREYDYGGKGDRRRDDRRDYDREDRDRRRDRSPGRSSREDSGRRDYR